MNSGLKKTFSLFEVIGVELEYMIVDRETLAVKPVCDKLLSHAAGKLVSDYDNGAIAWSNEIVNHVVELKTNGPVNTLEGLDSHFHTNVLQINDILLQYNAMLLPSGAHPWMNPFTETKLWEHEYNEIYALYNRIFDCRGHGWSNLQSTHINLPFSGDEEFAILHAAIRLILPLIPAISASTPLLDGRLTGFIDSRLEAYRHNQDKIPSIAGKIVPEAVFSQNEYHERIFKKIVDDITPYDKDGVLEYQFLNSRGAIARFDRGAIEIRLIDIQECPRADLAIVACIVALLKKLTRGDFIPLEAQQAWSEHRLYDILLDTIQHGEDAIIHNPEYLKLWGMPDKPVTASELWKYLLPLLKMEMDSESFNDVAFIVEKGTLSSRIINALNGDTSLERQMKIYRQLSESLITNQLFNCVS
ncbi:carboxylate-amine ligase [Alkaliflexus imshenetskii]|uniref:carboxylate-amine ligase n=1 Tax=Alkaliflexus imshenetskii TaxID=286730 RepID=UPI00047A30F9|nr:glutamate-cysteine ligase family protein [Alkaliflexus imshenetskii]